VRLCAVRQTYIPEGRAQAVFLSSGQGVSLPQPPLKGTVVAVGWGHGCIGGGEGGYSLEGDLGIHAGFEA